MLAAPAPKTTRLIVGALQGGLLVKRTTAEPLAVARRGARAEGTAYRLSNRLLVGHCGFA